MFPVFTTKSQTSSFPSRIGAEFRRKTRKQKLNLKRTEVPSQKNLFATRKIVFWDVENSWIDATLTFYKVIS